MARTDLPVRRSSHLVVVPAAGFVNDAANDLQMVNNGHTWILVVNVGGAHNAAAHITRTVDGQPVGSIPYPIPAGWVGLLGPFPTGDHSDLLLFDIDSIDLHCWAFDLIGAPLA